MPHHMLTLTLSKALIFGFVEEMLTILCISIIKAHPYRRASFPEFPKVGNIWRTISIFEGVLSLLFVKFS